MKIFKIIISLYFLYALLNWLTQATFAQSYCTSTTNSSCTSVTAGCNTLPDPNNPRLYLDYCFYNPPDSYPGQKCFFYNALACGGCIPNDTQCYSTQPGCTPTDTNGCSQGTCYTDYVQANQTTGCGGVAYKACRSGCSIFQSCNQCTSNYGACTGGNEPTNTCGTTTGSQTCTMGSISGGGNCNPTPGSQSCSYFYNNCSNNYTCTNGCTTTIIAHAFRDDNNDNVQDNGEPSLSGVTMNDNGYIKTTDSNGNATDANTALKSGVTAYIQMSFNNPFGGLTYRSTSQTKSLTLTNNNGGSTIDYPFVPVYSIQGYVYNDKNKNNVPDSGEGINGWTVTIKGNGVNTSTTTVNNGVKDGSYTFSNLVKGNSYTITLQTLPFGYSHISSSSWVVNVGTGNCSTGGDTSATCNNPNTGSITNLDFSVTNENPIIIGYCTDMRYNTGYSQLIPGTLNCNNTAAPYAIDSVSSNSVCVNNPGILFSGNTNPNYGQGIGPSTTGQIVGDATFPELFVPRLPNTIATSNSFVSTTSQNLATKPIPLNTIPGCVNLSSCVLSETTPGGVYTTTPADGPVNITIQNTDGTYQLGKTNYSFIIGGNLTISSNVIVQPGYSTAFTATGDIHVAGNVGESDWTSLNPDIEGLYSTDKNFYVDRVSPPPPVCNNDGTPTDLKLNIKGSVVTNAAGNGGALVNNRDGCTQDLSCPTNTVTGDPLQILNAPGVFKTAYTFWQELNPSN